MLKNIMRLKPPSTIGIVGGGQLGRMMTFEAKRMGYNVIVLDPKPNSPTGQVADEQILADYSDLDALRALANKADVLTYEFEHIDADKLSILEKEGHRVYPSSSTLQLIQNKYTQKSKLNEKGIPVPTFYPVKSLSELEEIFEKLNQRMVLKTCTGGYDGKGNLILKDASQLKAAYEELGHLELMAEEFIDYTKEVSIIIAKNAEGITYFPIAENLHHDSILIKSIIPARISEKVERKIQEAGKKVVELIDDYGIFCIEFFVDAKENVLVNEIAPRPHNSGHYSIEGCITSQFEQIIRVITGMPLGATKLRMPCVMMNVLGSEGVDGAFCIDGLDKIQELEDCHFHLYGKPDTKYLKKIGHITALDTTVELAEEKATKALEFMKIEQR